MQATEFGGANGADSRRPRAVRGVRGIAATALVVGVAGLGITAQRAAAEPASPRPAAAAYVLSDVHCSAGGDGVLDLTLVNDSRATAAVFRVDRSDVDRVAAHRDAVTSVEVVVAPGSAHAIAYSALSDGPVSVPVQVDGAAQVLHADIDCDRPRLASAVSGEVDQGVAPVATAELPRTGGDIVGIVIGGLLVSAGIAASLIARRRYS